jgi:tetratricopeptide (TPR) repeat protein
MGRFLVCVGAVAAVACGGSEARPVVAKAPVAVAKPNATEARDHEHAVALLNEGDALVKVSVEAAIEKYGQALEHEPSNLDALWKLSLAYEKKEDWDRVAATLTRAAAIAPSVAQYWRRRGNALVELARAQEGGAYEAARESLVQCLKLAPKSAECAYLLGEVEEWTDHAQAAAERYTQALRQDPSQPHYYRALAALYRVFKRANEAERVLKEGMQRVEPIERNRPALARMSVSLAQLAAGRHDVQAAQTWLQQAEKYFDERSPEVAFEIGSIYAAKSEDGSGFGNREKALQVLNQFTKRTCRGSLAMSFKEQCELSAIMIQILGSSPATPSKARALPAPVPVALSPGLPTPKLEMQPLRQGDAYTVWGAGYAFRSRQHRAEVTDKPISISGYVVKTNLAQAPRCAVHRSGVADVENCRAEIPAFWLGDRPDAPEADCIKVMGFASTYAQLYEAIRQADSQKPDEPYSDAFWEQTVPNPLPAAGAKLTVRGSYGLTFAKASSGAESDPAMGILDFAESEVLEPAPELATLPGVKRRKR